MKEINNKKSEITKAMTNLSQLLGVSKKNALVENAAIKPQIFYCRHMEVGVAGYEDEVIYASLEAIKKMMPTFNGLPVYVHHVDDVNLETMREEADGYVSDCFYNELDGWVWAKFLVVSSEGIEAIAKGWSVSNAYMVHGWGSGGTWHNVDYQREMLDGEFTHLAIVPNPRYEDADIFSPDEFKLYQDGLTTQLKSLHNSKNGEKKTMRLFKNKREEITSFDENAMLDLGDGQEISLSEIKNAVEKSMEDEKKNEEEKMNMDSMIEVGDEKMPLKELVNRYKAMNKKSNEDEKENESDEDEKKNEYDEKENESEEKENEDEKENESEEDEKKNEEEEKQNAKNFESLKNAHNNPITVKLDTNAAQIDRGTSRYGS